MADELFQQETQADTTTTQDAGAGQPAAPQTSAPSATTADSTPSQQQAPATTQSWLEHFRQDIPNLPSDEAQARQLLLQSYQAANQYRELDPWVRSYMAHANDFNKWLQDRGQQKPAQQDDQNKPWYSKWHNPPEYNPSWLNQLERDETGKVVGPPEVLAKIQAYQRHRAELADKFWSNPYETLEEPVRHLAQEEARRLIQEELRAYEDRQSAQQFVTQNNDWLYARDQNGQPVFSSTWNPQTGQYHQQRQLSQWGGLFNNYLLQETKRQQSRGYNDQQEAAQLAMDKTQRDYFMAMAQAAQQAQQPQQAQQQAPQQTTLQQANQQFLNQQRPAPVTRPAAQASPAKTPVTRDNIAQVMLQKLKSVNGAA